MVFKNLCVLVLWTKVAAAIGRVILFSHCVQLQLEKRYRIRPIKRTVPNKRPPPPPPYFSKVRKAKSHNFPLAVSANQHWIPPFQQFLVLSLFIFVAWLYYWPINNLFKCCECLSKLNSRAQKCNNGKSDRQSLRGAVKGKIANTPTSEKFQNL